MERYKGKKGTIKRGWSLKAPSASWTLISFSVFEAGCSMGMGIRVVYREGWTMPGTVSRGVVYRGV